MGPVRPEFVPDASASREEMEVLQREVAAAARFEDALDCDPEAISLGDDRQIEIDGDSFDGESFDGDESTSPEDRPLVAGVDQAFLDDAAISAIVLMRGSTVIEHVYAVSTLSIPYIPGLLSFREGGPILDAFERLERTPDLVLFDGSGRIHFRQAGLATHMGVVLDLPSIGVAKNLLCGTLSVTPDGRPAGWRAPVFADGDVESVDGHRLDAETVIGYAYQSRQYDNRPVINPLYVSPGHRVSASTATDLVARLCGGYKLPEPTRLADAYADEVKAEVRD
ncbi:MAG: endonuclease V [Halobacteriota archaeon]